jgi:hypothetical protein
MTCKHEGFDITTNINFLADRGKWMAEVTIKCNQCGEPFQWLGPDVGIHLNGAALSPDGLELRIAIAPNSVTPSPLDRMVSQVRQDG